MLLSQIECYFTRWRESASSTAVGARNNRLVRLLSLLSIYILAMLIAAVLRLSRKWRCYGAMRKSKVAWEKKGCVPNHILQHKTSKSLLFADYVDRLFSAGVCGLGRGSVWISFCSAVDGADKNRAKRIPQFVCLWVLCVICKIRHYRFTF